MVLVSNINSIFKKEGTAQTYGQLITFPSQNENIPSNPQNKSNANTPKDTLVSLVPNQNINNISLSIINDLDRSKISIAAFSNNLKPSVSISVSPMVIAAQQNQKQDTSNLSTVYQNKPNTAIVAGSAFKSPADLSTILTDAAKVDLNITLHSLTSESIQFNTLEQISLGAKFVYNYYIPEETDIASQEDQSQDPLLSRKYTGHSKICCSFLDAGNSYHTNSING